MLILFTILLTRLPLYFEGIFGIDLTDWLIIEYLLSLFSPRNIVWILILSSPKIWATASCERSSTHLHIEESYHEYNLSVLALSCNLSSTSTVRRHRLYSSALLLQYSRWHPIQERSKSPDWVQAGTREALKHNTCCRRARGGILQRCRDYTIRQ